jgi:hypothetical protein
LDEENESGLICHGLKRSGQVVLERTATSGPCHLCLSALHAATGQSKPWGPTRINFYYSYLHAHLALKKEISVHKPVLPQTRFDRELAGSHAAGIPVPCIIRPSYQHDTYEKVTRALNICPGVPGKGFGLVRTPLRVPPHSPYTGLIFFFNLVTNGMFQRATSSLDFCGSNIWWVTYWLWFKWFLDRSLELHYQSSEITAVTDTGQEG